MAFDPDSYLAGQQPAAADSGNAKPAFDPNAYLAKRTPPGVTPPKQTEGYSGPMASIDESIMAGEGGGIEDTRTGSLVAAGMAKGALGLTAFGSDLGIVGATKKAYNLIAHYLTGDDKHALPDAREQLDRAFEFVGVKRPQNQQEAAVDQVSQFIGGTLAGALIPGGGVKSVDEVPGEIANARIWPSAGATSGVNRQIVTAQVAQRLGAGSGTTTLPWQQLGKEADRITGVFNAAESPTVFVGLHTDQITADIGRIAAEATPHDGRLLQSDAIRSLLLKARDGGATAKDLGEIAVDMGREATANITEGGSAYRLGSGLAEAQNYTRGLISETLQPAQRGLYEAARDQYKTYMDLIRPGMVNRQTGLVNIPAYTAHVAATDSAGYAAGKSIAAQSNASLYNSLRTLDSAEDGALSHIPLYTHTATILRALARVAPQAAQRMMQSMNNPAGAIQGGIREGLQHPAFLPSLVQSIHQNEGGDNGLQPSASPGP